MRITSILERPSHCKERASEFRVKPETGNPYGTAIAIVARIDDTLQIGGGRDRAPDVDVVIRLDDILAAGMRKLSVANDYAETSGLVHSLPDSERPAAMVLSISVNSYGSVLPLASPARAKRPRSVKTCCSTLTPIPPRLL